MGRFLLGLTVLAPGLALGQARPVSPIDCDDKFAECREDCAIQWGGNTNLKNRAKLNSCLTKCNGTERDCREAFFETRRNSLDEGSISSNRSSRAVDSDGLPTTTAEKKPEPKDRKDEEPREERPREQAAAKRAPEKKPELREDEIPRSSRSQITKVDDQGEKPKAEPRVEPIDRKPPSREEPKKEAPRAEEPAPAKKPEQREEPKREEKRRPLDEWDPDAL